MNPQDIKVGYFISLIKEEPQSHGKHTMIYKKLYKISNVIPFLDCYILEFKLNGRFIRLIYTPKSSESYKITTIAEERLQKIRKLFNESE